MKKKIPLLMALAILAAMMTACGQAPVQETAPETAPIETAAMETIGQAEPATEETTPAVSGGLDNFSVDSATVEDFAKQVQAAVAEQDLEVLAKLAAYPLYVGFADGSVSVNNAEELIALGAERIFTPELAASIEGAETADLAPSKAGFSLTKDGRPNIIFGVRDGALAIEGINY